MGTRDEDQWTVSDERIDDELEALEEAGGERVGQMEIEGPNSA